MPLLRPGVREEDVDAGERPGADHVRDDVDRVVADHPQVGQARRLDPPQQAADARRVDLDAEEVLAGPRRSDRRRGFAHAAADLEHARGAAPEYAVEVDERRLVANPVARQQLVERPLLRRRHSPLPQDETAHRPVSQRVCAIRLRGAARQVHPLPAVTEARPRASSRGRRACGRASSVRSRRPACTRRARWPRPSRWRPRRTRPRPASRRARGRCPPE